MNRNVLLTAFGVVLLLLAAVVSALQGDSRSAGAILGRGLGTVIIALGVVAVVRLAYRKVAKRSTSPFWSPSVFVIAGILALLLLPGLAREAREEAAKETEQELADAAKECDEVGIAGLPELRAPLGYRDPGPALAQQVSETLGRLSDEFEVKVVTRGRDRTLAYIFAAPLGSNSGELQVAEETFAERAKEEGVDLQEATVGGMRAQITSISGTVLVQLTGSCHIRMLRAPDVATARTIVRSGDFR